MLQQAFANSLDDQLTAIDNYEATAAAPVVIFGDDPAQRARLARIASRCGARLVAEAPLLEALTRLEMQARGHIIVDLGTASAEGTDRLLDGLEAWQASGTVIVANVEAAERLFARSRLSAEILVAPEDGEILAGFDAILSPPPASVHDRTIEAGQRHLHDLREELSRIARTLSSLSGSIDLAQSPGIERNGAEARGVAARAEIRQRRLRSQYFDAELFADPAWDILLDLAAAGNERRRVAVSSLCIAAAVPPTTALRWITQMTEQGLLHREPDPDDRRRVFVALSEASRHAMDRYLDAVVAMPRN